MGESEQKVLTQLSKRRFVTFTLSGVTLKSPIVAKAAEQSRQRDHINDVWLEGDDNS